MQEEGTRGAVTRIVNGAKRSEPAFEKAVKKFPEEIQKSRKPKICRRAAPFSGVISGAARRAVYLLASGVREQPHCSKKRRRYDRGSLFTVMERRLLY